MVELIKLKISRNLHSNMLPPGLNCRIEYYWEYSLIKTATYELYQTIIKTITSKELKKLAYDNHCYIRITCKVILLKR
jgi:hypothetical protein